MITRTKIKSRRINKTNNQTVETVSLALKNKNWMKVAQFLSASTRKYSSVNLSQIDKESSTGDTVLVLGKVLGAGELTKKVRICALSFSSSAQEKIKKSKSESALVLDEIKNNPKAEGIKIIK